MGVFGVGCLIEGPVKLDVFFEREGGLAAKAAHRGEAAVGRAGNLRSLHNRRRPRRRRNQARAEINVLGFLQGATWPVRMLARGQINTFLFCEILLVETAIVPLMLLEKDRRAFHRNMFTRGKLIRRVSARNARVWLTESKPRCAAAIAPQCAMRISKSTEKSANSRAQRSSVRSRVPAAGRKRNGGVLQTRVADPSCQNQEAR